MCAYMHTHIHARRSVVALLAGLSTWREQTRQRACKWLLRRFYHHNMTKSLHRNDISYIRAESFLTKVFGNINFIS